LLQKKQNLPQRNRLQKSNLMLDICIIGGGTAGITAAKIASDFHLKTTLFEKKDLGGVCLNCGCIQSKVYLESLRKKTSVNEIYEKFDKIRKQFAQKTKLDLVNNGVEIIENEAKISEKSGELFVIKSGEKIYKSKYLIIASGSIPRNIGIDFPKTADEIPESVNIIGGGIAGFEAAEIFNALGSKVSVFEISDKFCANLSQNAVKILVSKMKKDGIEFYNNYEFNDFENPKCGLSANYFANGRIITNFDFGNDKNVFVIGDANGKSMLAHTASIEAFSAVNKILGKEIAVEYEKIPLVLYTNPSIARVGVLPEASEKYEVRQMPLSGNGKWRSVTEAGERGLCEAVIEKETQRVAGLHLISPNAEEVISAAAIIVQQNLTISDVEKLVFPHPTISEVLRECILYGQVI